ncbi:unnamed protein product, partial [Allacma fusca]
MIVATAVSLAVLFCAEPDLSCLLYSALEPESQTPFAFAWTFLFEMSNVGIFLAPIYFFVELILLFFNKSLEELASMISDGSLYFPLPRRCQSLRQLILRIRLFNIANSSVIFVTKVAGLTVVLLCCFFGIKYFK